MGGEGWRSDGGWVERDGGVTVGGWRSDGGWVERGGGVRVDGWRGAEE